jgi:hypothetical protein
MPIKGEVLTTILTVLTSVFLVSGIVLAVTTIGADISTDGNLTVSGAANLNNLTVSGAISFPTNSITDAMVVDSILLLLLIIYP